MQHREIKTHTLTNEATNPLGITYISQDFFLIISNVCVFVFDFVCVGLFYNSVFMCVSDVCEYVCVSV